jgi:predicted nucleotidyltransferase/uncharacterized protein with HEPN domain
VGREEHDPRASGGGAGRRVTRHDDMLYVALMRDDVRGVLEMVGECSREEFLVDELHIGAAAFHFTRLAEWPLKASEAYRASHPEIPWEDLAVIRDRVEPEMFREDPAVMWAIATDEFPALLDSLEALLPQDDPWRYRKHNARDEELVWPETEPDATPRIPIPTDALAEICRRYDVRRLRVCGSVLRDDFGPDSDIDFMPEFGPNAPQGLDLFQLDEALTQLFGREADVMHGKPVRYIREQMMAEAKTIYVAPEVAMADNDVGAAKRSEGGVR